MKAALQNYQDRMRRVLDHIDRHLDADLDLDTLSRVAAFSKFHFHRQFTATFGLSVHRYVQLARLKRASRRLAYSDAQRVTDIAMVAAARIESSKLIVASCRRHDVRAEDVKLAIRDAGQQVIASFLSDPAVPGRSCRLRLIPARKAARPTTPAPASCG
jgi:methylphosphotriester-DNA--protein-cysteine methyltransferase